MGAIAKGIQQLSGGVEIVKPRFHGGVPADIPILPLGNRRVFGQAVKKIRQLPVTGGCDQNS